MDAIPLQVGQHVIAGSMTWESKNKTNLFPIISLVGLNQATDALKGHNEFGVVAIPTAWSEWFKNVSVYHMDEMLYLPLLILFRYNLYVFLI